MSARVLAALFATFLFSACAQTQGETCELDEDCEGDLVCCELEGMLRGTCRTDPVCRDMQAARVDASVTDGGPTDAGIEQLGLGRVCADAGRAVCAVGLECVRGICLLADEPVDVDAGSDAGQDAATSDAGAFDGGTDAGQDAGLDSGA